MIVGLTGKKRAGKDSAAAALRSIGFSVDSFAAPIRHFVAEILGIGPDELERAKEEPLGFLEGAVTPRRLMQTIGTDWGRWTIDPDLWVKLLVRRIERRQAPHIVITDCRFDNEAVAIKELGGIVIEIRRPLLCSTDTHVSENGISTSLIDHTIDNSGTLDDLRASILNLLGDSYGSF